MTTTNPKFVNYNDFGNLENSNMNIQQYNQNYHDIAVNKPVHQRVNQQAANVLFVADLPEETCEEDLVGLFKDYNYVVGRVTNTPTKTFALAHFQSAEWAEKARNELNGIKLTSKYATVKVNKPIRLCRWETKLSISERKEDDYKKNLLVKNLSKDVTAHYFWNTFRKLGDVRSCKLAVDYLGNSKGFGYITYYNLNDAENARNMMNGRELCEKVLSIDFLQPGIKKTLKKNNVYVKHFPRENFSAEELKKTFVPYGEIVSVMVAPEKENNKLNKGFGFVCFKNVDDAEKAQRDLNGKKIWEDLPSIYVNFAMKKEERLEHLQRKKEELKKNSSRMTIFCKIKEGFNFESENEFNLEIMKFLGLCFGTNYDPRSLKSRIDTRTAFITLNSASEVDTFIQFYSDYAKQIDMKLYFNLYKSKIERINASTIMKKKYNDFNNTNNSMNIHQVNDPQKHFFKNYNNFDQNQMNNAFMMMNMANQGMQGGLPMNDPNILNNPHMMNFILQQQQQQQQQINNMMNNNPNLNLNDSRYKVYNDFNNNNNNNNNINNNTTNEGNKLEITSNVNNAFGSSNQGLMEIQQQSNNNNFINNNNKMQNDQINNLNNNTKKTNINNNINTNTNINNNNNVQVNEEDEKNDCLDKIYDFVYKIHPNEAPKITGMIGEMSLNQIKDFINNPQTLESVVKSAYLQLHN